MRSHALSAGTTQHQLRWRTETGALTRLRRGVYAEPASDQQQLAAEIAAATLKLSGEPVASHETAAALWGLPALRPPPRASEGGRGRSDRQESAPAGTAKPTLQLTRVRRRRGTEKRYPQLVVHHAGLPPGHRTDRVGVPVTTVARTVVDVARTRSLRAGLVVADAALRARACTRAELLAVCTDCARWPGIRTARTAATLADARAESPLESISRAAFHEWGVPPPELQAWVTDYDRVDFLWPEQRVIGEADGMRKYADPDALRREKTRQELLERLGYRVVRWTWREVLHRPDAVAAWILAALGR